MPDLISQSNDYPEQHNPNKQTIDRVLAVLDSEIENIRDTETRQGWTSWGLVGGIIGSLWLLSNVLKSEKLQPIVIGTVVLTFSLLVDSLKWLIPLLSYQKGQSEEQLDSGGVTNHSAAIGLSLL